MSDSRITVEWALRKVKVRPEVFLKSHNKEFDIGLTYLSRNALKFDTKKEAEDYARCLYQDTGVAWEPIAFTKEENDNAEKTF